MICQLIQNVYFAISLSALIWKNIVFKFHGNNFLNIIKFKWKIWNIKSIAALKWEYLEL